MGVDMASGKTLYAMDETILAYSGRKTEDDQAGQGGNRDAGQRSARDEHQASSTLVLDGVSSRYLGPLPSPDLSVLDWSVWGQFKRHLVRTESCAHLRT